MKCIRILISLLGVLFFRARAVQGDFNYLVAAYNYAIAIKHNFDTAGEYYGEYLSQEVEEISVRFTNRLIEALETQSEDPEHGRAVSTCADTAAYALQNLLQPVHREFLTLNTEANKLHQAVNVKMMENDILILPMDDLYYKFTDKMLGVYMKLNDELVPKLMLEVVELVQKSATVYAAMDDCLNQIN